MAVAIEDELLRRQRARPLEVADLIAAELSDHSDPDSLAGRLRDDERLAVMLVESLEVAMRTSLHAKRRAMARVVSQAVLDDALVDESQLLLQALREFEAPHFRALERIRRAGEEAQRRLAEEEPKGRGVETNFSQWRDQVPSAARREPWPVIMALVRHGAVSTRTGYNGNDSIRDLTRFGKTLLEYVKDAGFSDTERDRKST